MGFFSKLFGGKKSSEKVEFWQMLPFNIFNIPDEKYEVSETQISTTMDGEKVQSYKGFKKEKSVHPWLYDSITVRYSESNKTGKTVNLTKSIDENNLDRVFEFIDWISSIYNPDEVLTRDEKLEITDSIDNPDGFWMGRMWMDESIDPNCGISLEEGGNEITTTFWFSAKVSS